MIVNELCLKKVLKFERKNMLSCHVSFMNLVVLADVYDDENKEIRSSKENISIKYKLFKSCILNNIFMKDEEMQNMIHVFGKYNRLCMAITLLKSKWLYKRKKHVYFDNTISFELMKDIPKHLIVPIYEDNHIFHVYLKDISSVIKHSLYNQHNLFIEPIEPKNPYTNTKLSEYTLYTICLKLKEYNLLPDVTKYYFKCDFNLEKFKSIHYIQLQMQSIRVYLKRLSLEYKYNLLVTIFSKYDRKQLQLFSNTIKQIVVSDCNKLIYAEIVLLCFDEGYYDLIDYYTSVANDEVRRLKHKYKMYLQNRTNCSANNNNRNININTNLFDYDLETIV